MLHKLMFKLLEEIIKLQICVTNPYEKKNNQNKQDFFILKLRTFSKSSLDGHY